MHDSDAKTGIQGRSSPRVDLDEVVTIRFDAEVIEGNGRNISEQGVHFVAATSLRVTVHIEGRGDVRGHLVRIESRGDGSTGIAVRFDEPRPDLMT
jgi:hypothetical protein